MPFRRDAGAPHEIRELGILSMHPIAKFKAASGQVLAGALLATTAIVLGGSNPSASQAISEAAKPGLPSNREIFGYVQDLVDFGPRRTGTEANVKTADYIANKFRDFGLRDVAVETGTTTQWSASKWGLSIDGVGIPAFYMRHSFNTGKEGSFSTGSDGIKAEFIYVGNRKDLTGIDVRGKVVVADVELGTINMAAIQRGANLVYDPAKTLNVKSRLDPFTPNNFPFNFASAVKGGAVGFIGILSNYMDSNRFYNEDVAYFVDDDFHLSLPGLWLSRKEGDVVKAMLREKPNAVGRLDLEGEVKKVRYRTVLGHLPGQNRETIMVQSHHDSGFSGAVEDATGVAEVLALARYYGHNAQKPRNRSMVFVAMDSHFTGYEAHEDFAKNKIGSAGLDVVANVTVEHVAREMEIKNGEAKMTGHVDPRVFITSPSLIDLTSRTVQQRDYRRSLVISTKAFPHEAGLPTDVGPIRKITGIPVISLISAPAYLYDISDTLDKVAVDQLQPTASVVSELLDGLDTMPRGEIGLDK